MLFQRNTEGRISIVHHEVVPNYMRTKLDLDLEAKQKELAEQVTDKGTEISAEIKKFNEMLSSSLERVTEVREEVDDQKSKAGMKSQTVMAQVGCVNCHCVMVSALNALSEHTINFVALSPLAGPFPAFLYAALKSWERGPGDETSNNYLHVHINFDDL